MRLEKPTLEEAQYLGIKRIYFAELEKGRFVERPTNDGWRYGHIGAAGLGVRYAHPWTFHVWSTITVAELWQWVALAGFLDPSTVPIQELMAKEVNRRSASGLLQWRLLIACQAAQVGSLECLSDATDTRRSMVGLRSFTDWANDVGLPLPAEFPKAAPQRGRRKAPAEKPDASLLRLNEFLPSLPFARATLWRRVRSGTFPAPVKVSAKITAWKRSDVEAWVAAQVAPDDRQRRAGKVDRSI